MSDPYLLTPARSPCVKCGGQRGCGGARRLCNECYNAARQTGTLGRWPTEAERRAEEQR